MVPVDSFDFTGISQMTSSTAANYSYIHYVRATDNPAGPNHFGYWRCVWPGRYDGAQGSGTTINPRQETVDFNYGLTTGPTTAIPTAVYQQLIPPTASPGVNQVAMKTSPAFGVPGYPTSYNAFAPMMMGDFRMGGPNPLTNGTQAQFPYGGFARDGDLLQVPFVGAYTVFLQGNFAAAVAASPAHTPDGPIPFLEMNSLPMDASFADDCDSLGGTSDDPVENVGRFCPIYAQTTGVPVAYAVGAPTAQTAKVQVPDAQYRFETNQTGQTFNGWLFTVTSGSVGVQEGGTITGYNDAATAVSPNTLLFTNPLFVAPPVPSTYILKPPGGTNGGAYNWTGNIFSYLTVTDPSDDYIPNVDPGANVQSPKFGPAAYALALGQPGTPIAVNNEDFTKNGDQTQENTVGVDGLININTASAKVLSMLPWVSGTGDPNGIDEAIATAIVADRSQHGAYNTIMDLARVTVQVPVPPGQSVSIPLSLIRANGGINPVPPVAADGNVLNVPVGDALAVHDLRFSGLPFVPPCGDFQTQFLAIDRVSNLITTRSDSFTVYVVVEGWTNPGTASAALVSTRRVGYIVDRSAITPTNSSPKLIAIPQN
jgi:hypothetical protein